MSTWRFSVPLYSPAARKQAIETGDLVSNAPLRARCEWLLEHDPEFTLSLACFRMADAGFGTFEKKRGHGVRPERSVPDTTHLRRLLGMADLAPTNKNGRRYVSPKRTEWIPYDTAVAITRALGMDPVDAGV
jgi:hypothetical protein